MAEKKELKKGKADFILLGNFKRRFYQGEDITFKMNNESQSGFVSNRFNLRLECDNNNEVDAVMWGGYKPSKKPTLNVSGKKKNDKGNVVDDFKNRIKIEWEDRHNEEILSEVGEMSFIKIGIEKDVNDKLVIKKFLSEYDAVQYLNENLKDDMVIKVRGNMKYSKYDGKVKFDKEIRSIYLSDVEDKDKFFAKFTQTILIDEGSVEIDKENKKAYINSMVPDYFKPESKNGEKVKGYNIPYLFTFEMPLDAEHEKINTKIIKKWLKPKENINEITFEGDIVESGALVDISEDDIHPDIKELIDLELYSMEDYTEKAVGKTSREKRMILVRPLMKKVTVDGEQKIEIAFEEGKYTEDDLDFGNTVEESEEVVEDVSLGDLDALLGADDDDSIDSLLS